MESSKIFFPLRTNANYFKSKQEYLDLKSRVKQSLILFDELLFQAGEYHCIVGPKGIIQGFKSHQKIGDEQKSLQLEEDEKEADHFWLRVRTTDAQPSESFTTIIDSPLERRFRSQFHTLVSEMKENGIDSVELRYYEFPDNVKNEIATLAKTELEELEFDTDNIFLKDRIIQNLNNDLLLMSLLKLPATIDALHAPLVLQKAKKDSSIIDVDINQVRLMTDTRNRKCLCDCYDAIDLSGLILTNYGKHQ
jgi:hypothetical protein